MISRRLVLVLGAGTSAPYGFPLASRLVELIGGDGSDETASLLAEVGCSRPELQAFQKALLDARVPSVDSFLESNPRFEPAGKAMLAHRLLVSESTSASKLFGPTETDDDWYRLLWHRLWTVKATQFSENQLSVITFNYDRSFEYALFRSLRAAYELAGPTAIELLDSIPIVHVYGELGNFKEGVLEAAKQQAAKTDGIRWRPHDIDYGRVPTGHLLKRAMAGVKILHEGGGPTPEFQRAHQLLEEATVIAFLGFGYHEQNMERLRLPEKKGAYYASAYERTESEKANDIVPRFGSVAGNVHVGDSRWRTLDFLRNNIHLFIQR